MTRGAVAVSPERGDEDGRAARSGVTFASLQDVPDLFALAEPELLR
jgi:hypothetical protein